MDKASLRRLAESGISSTEGEAHLRSLSEWCWEHGEALGDAALLITARALEFICDHWATVGYMHGHPFSDVIRQHLPGVLDGSSQEERTAAARMLKEDILLRL